MFVGIRDLWFARGRFALMTSVVALVTFLVVVLSGLTGGLGAEKTSAIEGLPATHIVFEETSDGPSYRDSTVDAAAAETWAELPSVQATAPLGVLRTTLVYEGAEVAVAVFAAPIGSWITPDALTADNTLLVSPDFAVSNGLDDRSRVQVGDVELAVSLGELDGEFSHQPVVWTDLVTWQAIVERPGKASVIAMEASSDDLTDAVTGMVATTVEDSLSAIAGFSVEQGSLQLMQGFLMFISALVVGAFFTVWTMQRRHDIAVLKAMGASTSYLLGDAVGQAAIVVVLAALAGGGFGFATGQVVSGTVPFLATAETILYPLILMSAIGLVGAGLATRSITKVDSLTALGASR